RSKREEVSKTKVKILVDKSVSRYIQGQTKYYGLVSSEIKGDQVEMTFMTTDWKNGFSRWYLMFGDYAKIIEPEVLRERVAEILTKSQERLSH
ncbi:MAG TPA: transcriptional regulator, partial [Muricauda sp.]|nr:transcriptional regulator [Allomuricauda sp.]